MSKSPLSEAKSEADLLRGKYPKECAKFEFAVPAEKITELAFFLKKEMTDEFVSKVIEISIIQTPLMPSTSQYIIGCMLKTERDYYYLGLITEIEKIDEHPDSEVIFHFTVTVYIFQN